jgi:hypothetical protein
VNSGGGCANGQMEVQVEVDQWKLVAGTGGNRKYTTSKSTSRKFRRNRKCGPAHSDQEEAEVEQVLQEQMRTAKVGGPGGSGSPNSISGCAPVTRAGGGGGAGAT